MSSWESSGIKLSVLGLHSAASDMYSVGEINQNRIKLGNQYQRHTEKDKINAYSIFLNNKGYRKQYYRSKPCFRLFYSDRKWTTPSII